MMSSRTMAAVLAAVFAAVSVSACGPQPVTLAIAAGPATVGSALLAYEDALEAGLDVAVDTVVVRETNNRAGPAVRAADTITSSPGVIAVMGHSNSPASLTAAPIYNRAGIVQLASHSTADVYSEAGPFSFRMVPPDSQQGRIIAEFLTRELDARRVALMYVNDDYGRGLRAAVLHALPDGAVEVVLDAPQIEEATPEMVRRSVLALIDSRPDAVVWLARTVQFDAHAEAVRAELGRIPIVGGDALNVIENSPDPDRIYPPVHFVRLVDLDARPATRAFKARYRARFGNDPADAAVLAYDAFALLLAGVREGARSGEEMRAYLHSLGRTRPPYQGVTGPVQFNEYGDASREYVMGHLMESGDGP